MFFISFVANEVMDDPCRGGHSAVWVLYFEKKLRESCWNFLDEASKNKDFGPRWRTFLRLSFTVCVSCPRWWFGAKNTYSWFSFVLLRRPIK